MPQRSAPLMKMDLPWEMRNILTLDVDGMQGLALLLILQSLMKEIKDLELSKDSEATSSAYSFFQGCSTDETFALSSDGGKSTGGPPSTKLPAYRPCHYFDYIGGSGTGGLIALLLGRFRMSIDDALVSYRELLTSIEGGSSFRARIPWMRSKDEALLRHYENFIEALHPIFPSPCEVDKNFQSDPTRCRTVICSIQSSNNGIFKKPYLFCSYKYSSDGKNLGVWDVARATSAAPFQLEPVTLGSALYYDATKGIDSSTMYVLNEVERAEGCPNTIATLLSVDLRSPKAERQHKKRGSMTLSDQGPRRHDIIHQSLLDRSKRGSFQYYRLDLSEHLNARRFEEVSSKSNCKKAVKETQEIIADYLSQGHVKADLRQIADDLVKFRLQRARTMQWERFATGVIYRCPVKGCHQSSLRFEDRGDLLDHLREVHDTPPPDSVNGIAVDALLDQGRTNTG